MLFSHACWHYGIIVAANGGHGLGSVGLVIVWAFLYPTGMRSPTERGHRSKTLRKLTLESGSTDGSTSSQMFCTSELETPSYWEPIQAMLLGIDHVRDATTQDG